MPPSSPPSSSVTFPPTALIAGCKVNLFLDILGRRPDGYHDIRSLFLPLGEPRDEMTVRPGEPGEGLTVVCDQESLSGNSNILRKAWEAYAKATGFAPDVRLRLFKGIPVGAGLGGGSSDAASLLIFLNRLRKQAEATFLTDIELMRLGAAIGADVPFFLQESACLVEGVGEILTPVELDMAGISLVLLFPEIHVSTAWAYAEWDAERCRAASCRLTTPRPERTHPIRFAGLRLSNDFEPLVFKGRPELGRLKAGLLARGATVAVMSGSGSSLVGLFRDQREAEAAALFFKQDGKRSWALHF